MNPKAIIQSNRTSLSVLDVKSTTQGFYVIIKDNTDPTFLGTLYIERTITGDLVPHTCSRLIPYGKTIKSYYGVIFPFIYLTGKVALECNMYFSHTGDLFDMISNAYPANIEYTPLSFKQIELWYSLPDHYQLKSQRVLYFKTGSFIVDLEFSTYGFVFGMILQYNDLQGFSGWPWVINVRDCELQHLSWGGEFEVTLKKLDGNVKVLIKREKQL